MMPKTINGLGPFAVLSCLQKAIRRGDERLAGACAYELSSTSTTYCTMLLNRLVVIMHEDLDVVSNPAIIAGVEATIQQLERCRKDKTKQGRVRMLIGTIIRIMCRAPKSREGDHFHVAIGRPVLRGVGPVIPDWAFDKHTSEGRRMGRGLEHFLTVSTVLVPPPAVKDPYMDEAIAHWSMDEKSGSLLPPEDDVEEAA